MIPPGTGVGDTFQAMCTIELLENGRAALVEVEDDPIDEMADPAIEDKVNQGADDDAENPTPPPQSLAQRLMASTTSADNMGG